MYIKITLIILNFLDPDPTAGCFAGKFIFFAIFYRNDSQDQDEESKTSLLHACRKMLKNTKKILARETKTLEITPLKASKSRSSLPGGGQKQTLQLISQ